MRFLSVSWHSENGVIAALVAGVILSGILACTMSTSDSQLLAASSSVSQNLIVDALKVNLSDKKKLLIARITVVIIDIRLIRIGVCRADSA